MLNDKLIICVSASFEDPAPLQQALEKYAEYSVDGFAVRNEFAFTSRQLPECDGVLVLNSPRETISVMCDPRATIVFMMEPGERAYHPWMFRGLGQYSRVYSPIVRSGNTIQSHGFLGWYFNMNYGDLKKMAIPQKTKQLSCISSSLKQLPGHRKRLNFIKQLKQEIPQVDLYGKGQHYLENKMDGLRDYCYSIAIENSSRQNYFTEKINDCLLSWTIPFYYGCKNISKYYPEGSYVWIDIDEPAKAIAAIRHQLEEKNWTDSIPALTEARELVLEKYQPLAGAAEIFREVQMGRKKEPVTIHPVLPGWRERAYRVLSTYFSKSS